jgi:recombinational DNA repair ATPase RecF
MPTSAPTPGTDGHSCIPTSECPQPQSVVRGYTSRAILWSPPGGLPPAPRPAGLAALRPAYQAKPSQVQAQVVNRGTRVVHPGARSGSEPRYAPLVDDWLLGAVLGRLDEHPVSERVADLVLAAFEGDDILECSVSEGRATLPPGAARLEVPQPAGAYLGPLTVTGFRGIGPSATLPLRPGPGLTLVVGRNGSGKSSFAEALELLFTGDLRRWADRSATWREGWRNLHGDWIPSIEASIVVEGATGPSVARRTWPPDGGLASGTTVVQVAGEKQTTLERLGWTEALDMHRPFLSHVELEAMLGKPSDLYDVLAPILGLDGLWEAVDRVDRVTKAAGAPLAEAKKRLSGLLGDLDAMVDERAQGCMAALTARVWALEEAERLATGVTPPAPGGQLQYLRQLTQLCPPTDQEVTDTVAALRNGAQQLEAVAATDAGRALALADLLNAALEHHNAHGDGPCPVCGHPDALDQSWRAATEKQVARLRSEAFAATVAQKRAAEALASAQALIAPVPLTLAQVGLTQPVAGLDVEALAVAWRRWAQAPSGDGRNGLLALAEHIEENHRAVAVAAEAVRRHAQEALRACEDAWAPMASRVAAWCVDARAGQTRAALLPDLKAAAKWMGGAVDQLRNERLAPLAEQAAAIWAELRQESNVALGGIRLAGSKTRRQVDFDLSVDGTAGPGLGVLSQGEVNALALSLFLPRATLGTSPFRFLVIDDPVQAMDPAKVEGLARVLNQVGASRQVVVLTHDDRLPEAVRRLGIEATILEVTRRVGSVVEVRAALDPPARALEDAAAIAADRDLPPHVAPRVVGALCRVAVEAAFTEVIRARQLGSGRGHAEVEQGLRGARTFTQLAALALFDDNARGGEVLGRLNGWGGRWTADTFQTLNKTAHHGHTGDLSALVTDSRKLVDRIRANL